MNSPVTTEALLIDAGRSKWGWSGIGGFMKCPRLWALGELSEGRDPAWSGMGGAGPGTVPHEVPSAMVTASAADSADQRQQARIWGSMGHVGLAHFYAQEALRQSCTTDGHVRVGTGSGIQMVGDPDQLLPPATAVTTWCQRNNQGFGNLEEVFAMLAAYASRNTHLTEDVLAVEWPVMGVIGMHPVRGFGLWCLDQDTFREPEIGEEHRSVIDGAKISFVGDGFDTRLNCPGHPRHGLPLYLSRRLDMVVRDQDGYWIDDHKCLAYVEPKLTRTAYAVDRGNVAMKMMGAQLWGRDFAGIRINFVSKRPRKGKGFYFTRKEITSSRAQEWSMAGALFDAYHRRARLQVETMRGVREVMPSGPGSYAWPDAGHDTGCCKHRYGNCDYLEDDGEGGEVRRCVG